MSNEKYTASTFIDFFSEHLPKLSQVYRWPIGSKAKLALPNFQWHDESGSLDECISLKHHLTRAWAEADDIERARLAQWIVSDWGGVRANRPSTLELHLSNASNDKETRPLKGVASYSKILSVVDCNRYAIYDARVASCLNAVQLQMEARQPVFFHYVPSRNKTIQGDKHTNGFVNVFSKKELVVKRGWHEIERDATYATYLDLLHTLKGHFPQSNIYHFEMVLFGIAPDLCARLVSQHLTN